MSCNLTKNAAKNHSFELAQYFGDSWYWGKACKTDDGFEVMSSPQTCKDYLVDIQYRDSYSCKKINWTTEQLKSNCYYILMPTKAVYKKFMENMIILNTYEKKHRFARTVVTEIEFEGEYVVVIEGSKKWTVTTTALSFYLSLIRLCGYNTMDVETLEGSLNANKTSCNEFSYFRGMSERSKALYNYYYKNPRLLMPKLSDEVTFTGYDKQYHTLSHGVTGLFYLLGQRQSVMAAPNYKQSLSITTNYFYKQLMEIPEDVTM